MKTDIGDHKPCPHCGYYCLGKTVFCNQPIFPNRAEGTSAGNSVQLLAEKERRYNMIYKPILVVKEKASEIFESLLCNPDGDIAIVAPNYEKKMLKAGIEKVKELEWSEKFHREASEFSDNEIYWKKSLLNKNLKEIFEKIECMEDLAWAKEQLQKVIELRYKDVLEAKGEKNDKIAEQKDNRR